jgi:hypothetical protein
VEEGVGKVCGMRMMEGMKGDSDCMSDLKVLALLSSEMIKAKLVGHINRLMQ